MLTWIMPDSLLQTAVYMVGIFGGYALATSPDDWAATWTTVRSFFRPRRD